MNPREKYLAKYGHEPTEFDANYLEILHMSKYRILSRPDVKMAKCANCGCVKEDGRKYIDFGLDIDWYGVVYLCSLCLKEIASTAGIFETITNRIKVLETENKTLTNLLLAQGDELRSKVEDMTEEVKAYFDAINLHTNDASSSISSSSLFNNEVSSGTATPEGAERETSENTGQSSEPAAESGLENLPGFAKLLSSDS